MSISYIQFININETAWAHGQVIEMRPHNYHLLYQ